MSAGFVPGFDPSSPTTWIVPGVGLAAAGLAWIVAHKLAHRKTRLVPPPIDSNQPASDPFLTGSGTERRRAIRRGGNPVRVRIADSESLRELSEGWVVDRSVGGLCIMSPNPIPQGTILCVRTDDGRNRFPWAKIEVRHCRPFDRTSFALGCQFTQRLPWNELLLFG
jgi:hypothetical protein